MSSVLVIGSLFEPRSQAHGHHSRKFWPQTAVSFMMWWYNLCLRCHPEDTTASWQPSWWAKVFPFPFFPTYRQSAQQLCILIFLLLTWGIACVEIGETVAINGELFNMTILVIAAYLIGWLWSKSTTLPAFIAMLLTGIIFQNLQLVQIPDKYRKLNQDLRKVALVIMLMRTGLGLSAKVLKQHYKSILQLGILPWAVECIAVSITTHLFLSLPGIWSFLLGCIIASVSTAVLVPCMYRLGDEGYGAAKEIPTILLATADIGDTISVAIFVVILNVIFSTESAFDILLGPLSILVGVVLGSIWGTIASVVPEMGDTYLVPLRFLFLFLGGLFLLFTCNSIAWSGAGPLAIVSSGFTAAHFWNKQGWVINKNPVTNIFRILWIFFEPILFVFTGAQITIGAVNADAVKLGSLCLLASLMLRMVVTFIISFGCGLNKHEKLFIGVTGLAKATTQAALGPVALDLIRNGHTTGILSEEEEKYASIVLTMSVLSVVLFAPLGYTLITVTGPRLLSRDPLS
ncbi:sodium/hydrogen exchanger 9B2-like [Battus philenor]|uniref:sodium/hydrogen exchanger 9B2-like n=1 Tax=Battus philenor TaxID=42288 RepID=UPI0035CEAD27